ncbi:MAG: hypothetical protein PUE94_05020 [Lachnospiraceae bacterium]|nr:hypothetical protein [Lachnospiraceae bacterium]
MFYFTVIETHPLGDVTELEGIIRGYNLVNPPALPLKACCEGNSSLGYISITAIRLHGNFPNAAWASLTMDNKAGKQAHFLENVNLFDTISDYDLYSYASKGIASKYGQTVRFAKSSLLRLKNIRMMALTDAYCSVSDLVETLEKTPAADGDMLQNQSHYSLHDLKAIRHDLHLHLKRNLYGSVMPGFTARIPAENDRLYYRTGQLPNGDRVLEIFPTMEAAARYIMENGFEGDEPFPVYADGVLAMSKANPKMKFMVHGNTEPVAF